MSTYPYLPGLPDDEDENSASALSRKRLASFARFKRPTPSQASSQGQKEKESAPSTGNGGASGAVGAGTGTGTGSGGVGGGGGGPPTNPPVAAKKDSTDAQKAAITKAASNMVGPEGKTATRSDVKETLKSMGLRCEDFTISVYSREQAHAILRRQGVEVTPNNLQSREKLAAMAAKGGYKNARQGDMQRMPHNIRTVPPTNTWPMNTRPPNIRPQNIRKTVPRYEDDDDDCVILDPPDMPKPPPSVTLPQQFQLMGTTVQVNRGAKRPNRPMMNQPQAKRQNARPMQYYHKEHEEYGAEASVQDTLKRLKNYNISITCRRNASGLGPRGPMDGYSDMDDDSHLDSDEEEEDMTKYLECQIGEIDDIPEQEIFDEEIDPDDKDDVDYNPRGNKKRRNKSPRKGRRISSGSIRNPASAPPMEASLLDSSLEMIETDDNNDYIEREERNDEEFSPKQPSNEDREESESPMKSPEQSEEDKEDKDLDGGDEAHGDNDEEEQPERQEDVDEANSEHEQENEDVSKDDEVENEMDGDAEDPLACETKDDNNSDNVEEMISKEMEEENPAHDGPEDEEIDDELEKELLAGDVGEGEMEEEL